jgi:hypothetical protein
MTGTMMKPGDLLPLSSIGYPNGAVTLSLTSSDVAVVLSVTGDNRGTQVLIEAPCGLYLTVSS